MPLQKMIQNKIQDYITQYKKTQSEGFILLIYKSLDFLVKETGVSVYFEEVCEFLKDISISEINYGNVMLEEIEKMVFREEEIVDDEILYVMRVSNALKVNNESINELSTGETPFLEAKPNQEEIIEITHTNLEFNVFYQQLIANNIQDECRDLYKRYHRGLFKALYPILSFRTKDCINLIIFMSLETDIGFIEEIIDLFKDKIYHSIELLIYKAYILKKRNESFKECIKTIKTHIKTMVEKDNQEDKLFLTQIYLFYLGISFDSEIYEYLKMNISMGNKQIIEYVATKINRMLSKDDSHSIKNSLEIFDLVKSHSDEAKRLVFMNKEYFIGINELSQTLILSFAEFMVEEMKYIALEGDSMSNSFSSVLEIFFFIALKTKEMKVLLLHLLQSEVVFKSEFYVKTVFDNLFETFIFLFKENSNVPKKNTNLDFNQLMIIEDEMNSISTQLEGLKLNHNDLESNINKIEPLGNIDTNNHKNILYSFLVQFNDTNQWCLIHLLRNIKLIFLFDDCIRKEILENVLTLNLHFREENELIKFAIKNLTSTENYDVNNPEISSDDTDEKMMNNFSITILRHYSKSKFFYNRKICKDAIESLINK